MTSLAVPRPSIHFFSSKTKMRSKPASIAATHLHLHIRTLSHTEIRKMASYESLAPASTDKRDAKLVIREVLPGMVTFSLPFVSC